MKNAYFTLSNSYVKNFMYSFFFFLFCAVKFLFIVI